MGKWQLHRVSGLQLLQAGQVAHPPAKMTSQNRIIAAVSLCLFQIWKETLHFSLLVMPSIDCVNVHQFHK